MKAFRPFAPAVSLEQVHRLFEVDPLTDMPCMITIGDVREECRSALPALTHVNGSARVHTVFARDNSGGHSLLHAVGQKTGWEMVQNTSFHVKGQPIVNTPRQTIQTFLDTGIHYLFLENFRVSRKGVTL